MNNAVISTPPVQNEIEVAAPGGLFNRLLRESAEEWKFPLRLVAMIWWAPVVILLIGLVAALIGGNVYKMLTGEDRLAENLQVYCWLLAFGMGWLIARRLGKTGRYGMAFLYLCLNAGIFFIIGEEVSWGQRLFGWETPEALPEKYYFEISKFSEVVELTLALGFFLFISFQFRKIKPHG